jgi:hypothetical protein
MLRALRKSRLLLEPFAVVIAAMVVLGSADWWHVADRDDEDAIAFHDHAAHHLLWGAEPSQTNAPEHCYLCHWLRTFHHGLRVTSVRAQTTVESRPVRHISHSRPSDLVASLLPARAPPL